mmetsp:Transcript_78444/g.181971  ORF Transcript_78444/g.181971 Transcript_78444/m.181971 type:complete len:339 (-) Transcript_78444:68-1084(-)
MFRLSVALAAVSQCAAAVTNSSTGGLAEVQLHSVLIGPLRFQFPQGWALGNTLMLYWNARARALLKKQDFNITGKVSNDEIVASLPTHVERREPTKKQMELYAVLQSLPSTCFSCSYPHEEEYAPWRLIPTIVLQETSKIVKRLAAVRPALPSGKFAVVHIRCDPYIMKNHNDYGVLPHRFVSERMPHDVSRVIIVGDTSAMGENDLCGQSTHDLQQHLKETLRVKVELQGRGDEVSDWLLLSQAPILFCAASTFCFTAAMGNPNTVFMPVNAHHMCVSPPGPKLGTWDEPSRSGFHWVDMDYLPGKRLKTLPWDEVREYLHSRACDQKRFGCTPVKS